MVWRRCWLLLVGVWLRCLCLVAWCVGCMYCDYCVGWFGRFGLVAGIGWLVGLGLVVCLWLAGGFLCLLVQVAFCSEAVWVLDCVSRVSWLLLVCLLWCGFMRMDSIDLRWWFDDLCLILVLSWFVDLLFGSLLGVMIVLFTPVWVECFGALCVVNSVVRLHGCVYFNLFMICYFGLVYSLCTLLVLVVWLSCCLVICLGWFIGWLAAWWVLL